MITNKSGPDQIIREGFADIINNTPRELRDKVNSKFGNVTSYQSFKNTLISEAGLDEDGADRVASSTVYGFLEKFGVDPNEWKFTVDPIEKGKVKYDTEEFNEARKFLATWTQVAEASLFLASIASLATAGIATFLAGSSLKEAFAIIAKGGSLKALSTFWNLIKLRGIKWLTVPSVITALSTAWAYFANTQITATGDLETYVKQGVARGEEAKKKLEKERADFIRNKGARVSTDVPTYAKVKEAKPRLFIGTILGGKLADTEEFVRVPDDEITSEDDLFNDMEINLTKWLTALPGKLTYELQVKLNPFDEDNVKKQGEWCVLSLYINSRVGKRIYIDDILLGPLADPSQYWPDTRVTESVRMPLSDVLTSGKILPDIKKGTKLIITDKDGNKQEIFGGTTPATTTPKETKYETPEKLKNVIVPGFEVTEGPMTPLPTNYQPPTPTPQPSTTPTPTPTPQPSTTPTERIKRTDARVVNTNGKNLNVRNAPTTSADIIGKLPEGSATYVVENGPKADGYWWSRIIFQGKPNAWVAEKYLKNY